MVERRDRKLQTYQGADGKRRVEMVCWENKYSPTIKVPPELIKDGEVSGEDAATLLSMWRERSLWAITEQDDLAIGDHVVIVTPSDCLGIVPVISINGKEALAGSLEGTGWFLEYVDYYMGYPRKPAKFWTILFGGYLGGIKKLEMFSSEAPK